jgi:uncharacterized protein (UPF0548 family)
LTIFLLRPLGEKRLKDLWNEVKGARLSYSEVGRTAEPDLPAGYRHDRHEITLESGRDRFDRAVAALQGWQMHVRSGLSIFPAGQRLAVDQTVLVVIRNRPLAIVAPCRVVYVIEEADRFGFAYGTLPGHPERGEESFMVERTDEGVVRFTITAFSRPQELLVRLAGPIGRRIQKRATAAYLEAMRELSEG